ncbi:MAG: ABC transporter permease subunit [Thermomicrobiales bacterium]
MARLSQIPRWALLGGVAIYLFLPLVAIALYSVATAWTARALPDGYTLAHWAAAMHNERLLAALGRTFLLATAVMLLDAALVVPVAFWQRVRNPRLRVIVELAAAIPFVLPFIVIAFGILRLYGVIAPAALGTPWLLLLGQAAIAFPFLYWAVDGAMASIGVAELNEAGQVLGANAWQTLRLLVAPQIGPGLAAGGMLVFALSFGEFALAQLLVGARFETVSLYSLDLLARTNAAFSTLAVLTVLTGVILFAMSIAVVMLNRDASGRLLPGAKLPLERRAP